MAARTGTPLYLTTWGQWRQRALLRTAGYDPRLGWPAKGAAVATWGRGRHAWRARWLARLCRGSLVTFEDAPLRSLHPRQGPALGIMADDLGVHYDAAGPSRVAKILATAPLDDPHLLDQARAGIAQMRAQHLTKYAACDPELPLPDPGFVLVIDQVRGDAAAPDPTRFAACLAAARRDHPDRRIVIKTHPETRTGHRPGHFTSEDGSLLDRPVSPWALLDRAHAVYTVSSQLGMEAILAGHRPQVFGTPIYAGWGLTRDAIPLPGRTRRLTAEQLFAALFIEAPTWVDPATGDPANLEATLHRLAAQARAWREDREGWVISGASRWKRGWMRRYFGDVRFAPRPQKGRRHMAWGTKAAAPVRVEDGFLRSRGLGAALVAPQSLCLDDLGVHYDPGAPSRLEALIAASPHLPPDALARAASLRARLVAQSHSKYGLGGDHPELPKGKKILIAGQVADDASVLLGAPGLGMEDVLQAARAAHPTATVIFKPHPDVVAGLRQGDLALPDPKVLTVPQAELGWLIDQVDHVWTLTSQAGFEALLRGKPVTCLGTPFYAGWGLTRDLGPPMTRRGGGISLDGLVHAALIDYPRYWDPLTGAPCPVEDVLTRFEAGLPRPTATAHMRRAVQGLAQPILGPMREKKAWSKAKRS